MNRPPQEPSPRLCGGKGEPAKRNRVRWSLGTFASWRYLLALFAATTHLFAAAPTWQPLFNGRNLDGWAQVNCASNTFTVRDGIIVSTGVPTGILRTDRQYENFELELDYRHMKPGGNAGLFVWSDPLTAPGVPFARAIEVQILDGHETTNYTSHGDVFAIHGASFKPDRPHPSGWMRCLPSERRAKPAGEWNHYHVLCSNGVVQLAVNGKVVSGGSEARHRKGYVCLESEGSECHFRNLRIRELPSTQPRPDEIAPLAEPYRSLYTGLDLSGWKVESWHQQHWQSHDWILAYDGKAPRNDMFFWTQREFGDFVFIVDWRLPRTPVPKQWPVRNVDGSFAMNADGTRQMKEVQDAGDSGLYFRGSKKAELNIWCLPAGSGELTNYRNDSTLPADVRAAAVPRVRADKPPGEWNRFVITMRGDRITVDLNGQRIIENAQLPGIPIRGPFALQYHGDPIEFANLFVQELPPRK